MQVDFKKKMDSKEAQLELLQSEFNKMQENKQAQLDLLRSKLEQKAAHFTEGLAKLDRLNHELSEAKKSSLSYQTLNQTLTEKLASVSEMLEQEKSQNLIFAQQLVEAQTGSENVCHENNCTSSLICFISFFIFFFS